MAVVHRSATVPPTAVQIADAFGNAERYLVALGNRRTAAGDTLSVYLANNPGDIIVWAASRRQTPETIDKRAFARALIAMIDVANLVGFGAVGAGAAAPPGAAPPPAAALPPAAPFAGPAPVVAIRRGVIAYRMNVVPAPTPWLVWSPWLSWWSAVAWS